MPTSVAPNYPFSLTFHGNDIVEVRQAMVNFLADNVTPTNAKTESVITPSVTPQKKPRKPAKKKKASGSPGANNQDETISALSADTDTAPDAPEESTPSPPHHDSITPDEHPNVSLAYNSALEQLMEVYNGSSEGAYEVTLLLEHYRVSSFREIPEDRGVELLDKANAIAKELEDKQQATA